MQPNVVSYKQGKDVKYYIGQAGGYNQVAKKNKKYIIYMNGQIAAVKRRGKISLNPVAKSLSPINVNGKPTGEMFCPRYRQYLL